MSHTRLTTMAAAFAAAALKDSDSLAGKSPRWVARNAADKLVHADRHYSVSEPDMRPVRSDNGRSSTQAPHAPTK